MDNFIRTMIDLSTNHVPSPNPDWGDVRVVEHDYGWIVFVFDLSEDDIQSCVPEWLVPIWREAVKAECMLINFDRDSDTRPSFRVWYW